MKFLEWIIYSGYVVFLIMMMIFLIPFLIIDAIRLNGEF